MITRHRTTTRYDHDEHIRAIAGDPATMPPSMPLNIAPKRSRWRRAVEDVIGRVLIGLVVVVVAIVALYVTKVFVDWSIRTFWVP